MNRNPIPHCNLWNTRPLQEIQADIESLPPTHRALVYQYVMATLNSCHALVEEVIQEKETV